MKKITKDKEFIILVRLITVCFYGLGCFIFGCTSIILMAVSTYIRGMLMFLACLYLGYKTIRASTQLECEIK